MYPSAAILFASIWLRDCHIMREILPLQPPSRPAGDGGKRHALVKLRKQTHVSYGFFVPI